MGEFKEISEPLILAIETATRAGGVSVAKGDRVLSARTGDAAVSHSANLIEMIGQALNQAGTQLSEIDLFAAAVGPGSFTGLRIGLATVKALALCTGREVTGVNTLAAIAHASGAAGRIVSLLPAGRGEVFAQMFSGEKGIVSALDSAAHLTPPALLEKYGDLPQLNWSGDGAQQQVEWLRARAKDRGFEFHEGVAGTSGWSVTPESINLSNSVAGLALKEHRAGKSTTPAELHAVYVRASDAEIKERWPPQKAQP
ncbi:MAG TPA: tRNA (adenosine(37)-N6)-threonylcarbamoyltransferase complex dimerization subunit type 1 TsaB [Pyrinomonadaceae bacterium]|nr:tRNA (adenosine(37)-N6)-threonylcarbamoyltransferase complex dimerization subunit type 1 TsaB [Pyrinomonadaceae bacterium]